MAGAKKEAGPWLGKGRLEALSDGIFAFAMTLLVLNIEVPQDAPAGTIAADPVQALLAKLYPDFTHYFLAFLMLAAFWVIHHSFMSHVRALNQKLMWLNILSLMFIATIPFSTNLADTYVHYPLSALVFELNVFVVGALFWLQWSHASSGRRLITPEASDRDVSNLNRIILIMPAVSLVAMAAALMGVTWSVLVYISLPLVYALWPRQTD